MSENWIPPKSVFYAYPLYDQIRKVQEELRPVEKLREQWKALFEGPIGRLREQIELKSVSSRTGMPGAASVDGGVAYLQSLLRARPEIDGLQTYWEKQLQMEQFMLSQRNSALSQLGYLQHLDGIQWPLFEEALHQDILDWLRVPTSSLKPHLNSRRYKLRYGFSARNSQKSVTCSPSYPRPLPHQ